MAFDQTLPAGGTKMNLGDDAIRTNNIQLVTTIGYEHDFNQGGTQTGSHKFQNGDSADEGAVTGMVDGSIFIRTDTTNPGIDRYTGSAWTQAATLIPSGTVAHFYQNAAPNGWTFSAANDDKLLMVTDTVGEGGADLVGGTWTISGITIDDTVLDETMIPSHTHTTSTDGVHTHEAGSAIQDPLTNDRFVGSILNDYGDSGTGGEHDHTLSSYGDADPRHTHTQTTSDGVWRPACSVVIACTKN